MPINQAGGSDEKPVRKWNATDLTDAELMNGYTASGGRDEKSLRVLMLRHEPLVLNLLRWTGIRECDAEDVAAVVWFRVSRMAHRGTWNSTRAVHSADPFVPLLKKIAANLAKDFHRNAKRERSRMKRLEDSAKLFGDQWRMARRCDPRRHRGERPVASGVPECLAAAVAALPEKLRRSYELHAQGLGCQAIAVQLGCSAATASRWVQKARKDIGASLSDPRS